MKASIREVDGKIPWSSDGMSAPSIYVDSIRGASVVNGIAKISLVEARVDATTDELKHIHVGVIIVPVAQLRPWADFFTRMATDFENAEIEEKGQKIEVEKQDGNDA